MLDRFRHIRRIPLMACTVACMMVCLTQRIAHAQQSSPTTTTPPPSPAPTSPAGAGPSTATTLDATIVATQEYLKTGHARTVRAGDFLAFPYGQRQPTLTCAPLRACLIRLQPGETVLSPLALGDSERWLTGLLASGPGGATPLVYVKPTDCDLTTNLVIATDRHVYTVTLDAAPCGKSGTTRGMNDPTESYTSHLTFYYPDETVQQWTTHAPTHSTEFPLAPMPTTHGASPDELHFAYDVQKDRHFPWKPDHLFDDGAHVYVHRPASAANTVAPILFALDADGKRAILNYTIRGAYYITDRVADRLVFVLMDGTHERRLTLIRREAQP